MQDSPKRMLASRNILATKYLSSVRCRACLRARPPCPPWRRQASRRFEVFGTVLMILGPLSTSRPRPLHEHLASAEAVFTEIIPKTGIEFDE